MPEIIFSILVVLAVCVPVAVNIVRGWKRQDEKRLDALLESVNAEFSDVPAPDDDPVRSVVENALKDLKRQRAAGYGPWLSSLLDGGSSFYFDGAPDRWGRVRVVREWRGVGPEMALSAVRFTIRDLMGSRFSLDGLRRAERELMDMGA